MGATQRIASFTQYVGPHRLYVSGCARCGEVYGITVELETVRRRDGQTMYCPNGHPQHFSLMESIDERRIKELERDLGIERARAESAHRQREWAETRAKGANIAAGKARAKAARLQHRVECGVCPSCHRTFKQLAAHMLAKHGVAGNAACGVGREEQPRKRRK